ncbi:uncharacterized protein [Procambarus clarkii]|uniref:uncharacterized protein isoform X1 n=1 Tax=Procambarus clarkii TaxID=6728 RepID=UPI003742B4C9
MADPDTDECKSLISRDISTGEPLTNTSLVCGDIGGTGKEEGNREVRAGRGLAAILASMGANVANTSSKFKKPAPPKTKPAVQQQTKTLGFDLSSMVVLSSWEDIGSSIQEDNSIDQGVRNESSPPTAKREAPKNDESDSKRQKQGKDGASTSVEKTNIVEDEGKPADTSSMPKNAEQILIPASLNSWCDLIQFNNEHDQEWCDNEKKRLDETYGENIIVLKYISNQPGKLGYYCELCSSEMHSDVSLDLHCSGMKHFKKKTIAEKIRLQPSLGATEEKNNAESKSENPDLPPSKQKKKRISRFQPQVGRPSSPPRHPSPPRRHPSPPRRHPSPPRRHPSPPQRHPSPPRRHPSPPRRHASPPRRHPSPPRRHPSPPRRHPSPPRRHPSPPPRRSSPPYRNDRDGRRTESYGSGGDGYWRSSPVYRDQYERGGSSRSYSPASERRRLDDFRCHTPPPPNISDWRAPTPTPLLTQDKDGGATGLLLKKVADCSINNLADEDLASEVITLLLKALTDFYQKTESYSSVHLITETEIKFNIVKELQKRSQAERGAAYSNVQQTIENFISRAYINNQQNLYRK